MHNDYAREPLATDQTAWLQRAAELDGKSPFLTALMILSFAVEHRKYGGIVLNAEMLEKYDLKRSTVSRAVAKLEGTGLVHVYRRYGRSLIVDIIDIVEEPRFSDRLAGIAGANGGGPGSELRPLVRFDGE